MTDFNPAARQPFKNLDTDEYVLFLTSPFSQWYPSAFTSDSGQAFNCAEQYMMYGKALLFGDSETAAKILKAETPKEQKELGRQIKGFDADVWNAHAREIVYQGNHYKFTQNPHLFDVLAATAGKELVEAAHYDPIWGIGLRADDPLAADKANWKGTNWLGSTLTKLRDDLARAGFAPQRDSSLQMLRFDDAAGQRILYIEAGEYARQHGHATLEEFAGERLRLRQALKNAGPELALTAKIAWQTATTPRDVFEALNPGVFRDGFDGAGSSAALVPAYAPKTPAQSRARPSSAPKNE